MKIHTLALATVAVLALSGSAFAAGSGNNTQKDSTVLTSLNDVQGATAKLSSDAVKGKFDNSATDAGNLVSDTVAQVSNGGDNSATAAMQESTTKISQTASATGNVNGAIDATGKASNAAANIANSASSAVTQHAN